MLKLTLSVIFLLVLSSVSFCQEVSSDTSTLTPSEKAQNLLDNLNKDNNQLSQLSEDLTIQLDQASQQVLQLKQSLQEMVKSSKRLEQSLTFSQMVNKFAIPIAGISVATVIVETIILILKK